MGRSLQGTHQTALLRGRGTGVSTAPAGHRGQGLHLVFPDGAAVGIECELNIKAAHRYRAAVADVDPAWSAGVWFIPIAQVRLLQQRLSDAGGNGHHQVVTAPEGVAP